MSRRRSKLAIRRAVGITQKSKVVDADLFRRLGLLSTSHAGDLIARELKIGAAGVAVGADAIDDLDAGVGPGRDGPGGSEVDVVGMRGDDKDALDFGVGQRLCGHPRHPR